ncbi:hypothetical protein [Streptomyces sp. NPDC057340]|uniref:hypothetical protein n=1 Tax=Streptomyces sp. NPDC057340 TaxID=3346103 RepID=UPI0036296503
MIWSAVLSGAALRVLRTAAGRRALHVALLVGGVFVLGLLCGGRAQAADEGPGGLTETVGRVLDGTAQSRSRAPEAAAVQDTAAVPGPGAGALLPGLRPVAESVVQAVDDRVVRPAGAAVATVTEGVGLGLPGPSGSSGRPADPLDPIDVPDLVDVPGLIDVPDLIDLPGSADVPDPGDVPDPADVLDPADRGGAFGGARPAVPDPRAEPAPAVVDTSRTVDPSGDTADAPVAERTAGPVHVVGYGPQSGVGAAPDAHPGTHRAGTAHTGYAPAHPAPHGDPGDPDGALGTASGVDQGTPRHGDTRALAPQHRLAFRLVPGAPERADAAGVREPYRDIPVSPA